MKELTIKIAYEPEIVAIDGIIAEAEKLKDNAKVSVYDVDTSDVTIEAICGYVFEHFNVSIEDVRSTSRLAFIVTPRHVAMYFCVLLTTSTRTNIGRYLNRDHATVTHAYTSIVARILYDKSFINSILEINEKIIKKNT